MSLGGPCREASAKELSATIAAGEHAYHIGDQRTYGQVELQDGKCLRSHSAASHRSASGPRFESRRSELAIGMPCENTAAGLLAGVNNQGTPTSPCRGRSWRAREETATGWGRC